MLIKFALQLWMRNVSHRDGVCITKNVEYNVLAEAVKELERLEAVEFWAAEYLVNDSEYNRTVLGETIDPDVLAKHKKA